MVIALCHSVLVLGQITTLADEEVALQKATLVGLMVREHQLLMDQNQLLAKLRFEEREYLKKTNAMANASSAPLVLALEQQMYGIRELIADVEHNIKLLRMASLGLHLGWSEYQKELKNRKIYFEKLEQERLMVVEIAAFSGGVGHNYTALLKLAIRMVRLRSEILVIDRDVKGLMKFTKLFSK